MHSFLGRRMGRGPYWLLVLINSVVGLLLIWSIGFVMRHLMADGNGRPHVITTLWLMNPLFLAFLNLPTLVGTIWRLHDTGHRSWPVWLSLSYPICLMSFVYLAPPMVRAVGSPIHSAEQAIMALYGFYGLQFVLLGIFVRTIYLCCLRGDFGPNAYGPPPGGTPDDDLPSSLEQDIPAPPAQIAKTSPGPLSPSKPSFGKRGA